MKALFIGGTGTISEAVTKLAVSSGASITLLNRGNHPELAADGVEQITADINDENAVKAILGDRKFDVVANFVAFVPEHVERDIRLFSGKTGQYIFISSASAYQKPLANYLITEGTPLCNPFWQYSRDKIACENILMAAYRATGFPVTMIRPSHTYGEKNIPVSVHGKKGSWQVVDRILHGKPVIVHGDGLSLWTFTHSSDFAKGFLGLMNNPHAIGEAVHITSDESVTWNCAFASIGKALGTVPNLVHIPSEFLSAFNPELLGNLIGDKANSVVFDNSKIKRLVPNFCASVRFDQGVKQSIDYVTAHPSLQVSDPDFDAWSDRVIAAYCSGMLR
jgi:nucleoside-diphosphate-sugar epimerase